MMAYVTTEKEKVFSNTRLLLYVFDLSNELGEQMNIFEKVLVMLK